jgi:hypothetical protein
MSDFAARPEYPGALPAKPPEMKHILDAIFEPAQEASQAASDAGDKIRQGADEGSQKLAQGGEDAKAAVVSAAQEFNRIISSAASQLASQLANIKINIPTVPGGVTPAKVNANTGKTNKFVTNPTSVYHGPK